MKTPCALVLSDHAAEPRIDSRVIAEHLGIQHQTVFEMVKDYQSDFEQISLLRIETGAVKTAGSRGAKTTRHAMLTEDQCYLLLTYSRNTAKVRALKVKLVLAFREARQSRDSLALEYLPAYHALHDQIAELAKESENGRFVHMNVNKLVNKTVGIGSGERGALPNPKRSMIVAAQTLAAGAMQGATDHHDGYQRAKDVLSTFGQALTMASQPVKVAR